jgi:hypothetical protein
MVRVIFYTGKYISSRDTDVMGRAFWYPTMWSQERRPGSQLLARRVARRETRAFKALFPRTWVLYTLEGLLVLTHQRPRYVPEQLFVYTEVSALRERRAVKLMWIDVHAHENFFQYCNSGWAAAVPRAIHQWCDKWPAQCGPGQYLGSRDLLPAKRKRAAEAERAEPARPAKRARIM